MWRYVNDKTLLALMAAAMVLFTLHMGTFEAGMADAIGDIEPGERASLLCIIDDSWTTERGTMMWISDGKGGSIRVYADRRIDAPPPGSLTIITATMSADGGILFAESFRMP